MTVALLQHAASRRSEPTCLRSATNAPGRGSTELGHPVQHVAREARFGRRSSGGGSSSGTACPRTLRGPSASTRSPSARHILAIVLLAGVVRLFVPLGALVVHGNPQVFFQPDTDSYVQPAQSLVEHHRFATPRGPEMQRTPGYPLFLTLGVLADRIAAVTIAAQILLGTATVWLVALLARRVTVAGTGDASRPSIWAATAYALDPLSALYPSLLLTETLFTAVFVVHLLARKFSAVTRVAGVHAPAFVERL